MDKNTLFLDFGNSRMKYLINNIYSYIEYNTNFKENLKIVIEFNNVTNIYYSSVNSKLDFILYSVSQTFNISSIDISEILDLQKIIDFSKIKNMGIDRKLGLFGTLDIVDPPLVTVDCGTALTINYLDARLKCRGGVILAGMDTQFKALSDHTDQLKNYRYTKTKKTIGINTNEAINLGIQYSLIGAIKEFLFQNKLDNKGIEIIITGGYSEIIYSILNKVGFSVILKNNLVLDGINYLISQNIV